MNIKNRSHILHRALASLLCLLSSYSSSTVAIASPAPLSSRDYLRKPKLIVVLVIDQFRADYLTRFASRFLPAQGKAGVGGFRYLMENGAYYPFAEHDVLQNMTCPGHVSILTGAQPYASRIPLNEWFDSEKEKHVYCVDDDESPIVGSESSKGHGASPRLLKTTTVGDELKGAGYSSKVVAIGLKDRSAIMLGGHRADLAIWFDAKNYKWISSRYYLPDGTLPSWLDALNKTINKQKGGTFTWSTKEPETGLSNESDRGPFQRSFIIGTKDALRSPVGVALTTEAAIETAKALRLGQGSSPDILAISYSSHDMMGHKVGPNAREMEELTVDEDRNLSQLFRKLDKSVPGGLKSVLIVLTADHGVAPIVGQNIAGKLESALIDQDALVGRINEKLVERFGPVEKSGWIMASRSFNFYLNHRAIKEKKLSARDFENEIKKLLLKEPGVETAFSVGDYYAKTLPPGMYSKQIMTSYIPGMNGDVMMIPRAFFMEDRDPATHMTGYSYDRMVPLVIAGPNIRPGVYAEKAHVVDIAPTLSFLLGIIAPPHVEGRVLAEIIGK